MDKIKRQSKKIGIGMVGSVILVAGIVMVPYPGPGWLVVFIGLSILATEFTWARSVHDYAHGKYDAWQAWLRRQTMWIRVIFWAATCMVVVITIWLLNGYGLINNWLHLGQDWLASPFVR